VKILDAAVRLKPLYIYAEGENPESMDVTKSITILKKINDLLYEMILYGRSFDNSSNWETCFIRKILDHA